jgi:hypothetical protein
MCIKFRRNVKLILKQELQTLFLHFKHLIAVSRYNRGRKACFTISFVLCVITIIWCLHHCMKKCISDRSFFSCSYFPSKCRVWTALSFEVHGMTCIPNLYTKYSFVWSFRCTRCSGIWLDSRLQVGRLAIDFIFNRRGRVRDRSQGL